jgi:hypothetical protein
VEIEIADVIVEKDVLVFVGEKWIGIEVKVGGKDEKLANAMNSMQIETKTTFFIQKLLNRKTFTTILL